MQEIGNIKSIMYGIIITFIFAVSSCEFNSKPKLADNAQIKLSMSR